MNDGIISTLRDVKCMGHNYDRENAWFEKMIEINKTCTNYEIVIITQFQLQWLQAWCEITLQSEYSENWKAIEDV